MDKTSKPTSIKIEKEALTKFIASQFCDYRMPPLHQFLTLKASSGSEIYLLPCQVGPSLQPPPQTAALLEG